MRTFVSPFLIAALCGLACAGPSEAAPKAGRKIVFIAGHGRQWAVSDEELGLKKK